MLDGVYRRTEGEPAFQAARPTRAELEGLLDKNIVRFMKMLRRLGYAGQKVLSLRTVPGRDEKTTPGFAQLSMRSASWNGVRGGIRSGIALV